MKNVEVKIDGNKLNIEIDLTKDYGPSKSGKTIIIATTEGNKLIKDDIRLGLNCYRYKNNPDQKVN